MSLSKPNREVGKNDIEEARLEWIFGIYKYIRQNKAACSFVLPVSLEFQVHKYMGREYGFPWTPERRKKCAIPVESLLPIQKISPVLEAV